MLGIDDCGDAKTGETAAARNMEWRRLLVSGLASAVVEGDNGFQRLVADGSCGGEC